MPSSDGKAEPFLAMLRKALSSSCCLSPVISARAFNCLHKAKRTFNDVVILEEQTQSPRKKWRNITGLQKSRIWREENHQSYCREARFFKS